MVLERRRRKLHKNREIEGAFDLSEKFLDARASNLKTFHYDFLTKVNEEQKFFFSDAVENRYAHKIHYE